MRSQHYVRIASAIVLVLTVDTIVQAAETDYQRDVLPILAEHCTARHGLDQASREADLRLDLQNAVLKGDESGVAAILSGKPEDSELWKRITSADSDLLMPPAHHNRPLRRKHIETIR
ncbi:MAG: hypothetical protein P8K08_09305 [Fuerstiella sp.]|jgi:hypothetical protein|nr:hypothetical protein [Fuerstiella sp.]